MQEDEYKMEQEVLKGLRDWEKRDLENLQNRFRNGLYAGIFAAPIGLGLLLGGISHELEYLRNVGGSILILDALAMIPGYRRWREMNSIRQDLYDSDN